MDASSESQDGTVQPLRLKKLTLENVKEIDEMLASLGDYGEVRLVVQHGELRYINKMESFKAGKNETNQ